MSFFLNGKPFLGLDLGEEDEVEDSLFLAGVSLMASFLTYPALKTLKVTIDWRHLAW